MLFMPGYNDFFAARPRLQRHLVTDRPAAGAHPAVHHPLRRARPPRARRPADRPPGPALPPRPLDGDRRWWPCPRPRSASMPWFHRNVSVADLFSGRGCRSSPRPSWSERRRCTTASRLLDAIDRRFFREQFDARHILTLLVERIRSIRDSASLADLVPAGDRPRAPSRWGLPLRARRPLGAPHRPPPPDAAPGRLLGARAHSLERQRPAGGRSRKPPLPLPEAPRKSGSALADGGFRLLVPILARDGSLLGMIGARREEERPAVPQGGPPAPARHRQQRRLGARAGGRDGSPPPRSPARGPMVPEDPTPPRAPRAAGVRARQGVPEVRRAPPLLHRLLRHLQQEARAVARALHAAGQVPLRAADRHRRHGRGLQRVRPGARPPRGDQDPAPGLAARTPCGCGARRAPRPRSPTPTSRPSTAWRPGRGRRCWSWSCSRGAPSPSASTREQLAPRETVDLGIAMAGALAQLHAADILHRDVKPSNIGYTRDGVPKLMDFGIARVMARARRGGRGGRPRIEEHEDDAASPALGGPPSATDLPGAVPLRRHPLLPLARGAARGAGGRLVRPLGARDRALRMPAGTQGLHRHPAAGR